MLSGIQRVGPGVSATPPTPEGVVTGPVRVPVAPDAPSPPLARPHRPRPPTTPTPPAPDNPTRPTPSVALERPDWAYAEPFQFTARDLGNGKKLYNANVSIFQFQRAFNRLAQRIAQENPELVARYAARFQRPMPFALTADGQLGPNTNNAKMLLQEFLGFPPNELEFTAEHWARLREVVESTEPTSWVRLGFQVSDFDTQHLRNAARVIERLAGEDPVTLMKLAVALGAPAEISYVGFTAPATMVRDLGARLAATGLMLDEQLLRSMYMLDRTNLGGVTYMRARGIADLIVERDHMSVTSHDALIQRAVQWIRSAEPEAFARFTQLTGASDPENVLAALIKSVMSAESDFDRHQDTDASDVGLMQLTWMVAHDAALYMNPTNNPPWGEEPVNAPSPLVTNAGVAVSDRFPPAALDPLRNTAAGGSLIVRLFNRFEGHLTLAAAAYNVGPNKRELNLPEDERRLPNLYPTLAHSMRIQRRFPMYLNQFRAQPV